MLKNSVISKKKSPEKVEGIEEGGTSLYRNRLEKRYHLGWKPRKEVGQKGPLGTRYLGYE